MFVTLPLAFSRLPYGTLAAAAFFLLLAIAAFASAISMLELPVGLLERQFSLSRSVATVFSSLACGALGLLTIFSFNVWGTWYPLSSLGFTKATVFDLLDQLTSNTLLPIASFALAIFGGWVVSPALFATELQLGATGVAFIRILLRYVVPLAIAAASFAAVRF